MAHIRDTLVWFGLVAAVVTVAWLGLEIGSLYREFLESLG